MIPRPPLTSLQLPWLSYARLPARAIRLLRLNPNLCKPDVGDLEVAALDSAPPFYALSHSWGMEPQTLYPPAVIGGQLLHIGRAIAGVLPILRSLSADANGPALLRPACTHVWIDRICVDQKNVKERASQVALITDIFSTSIRTLVWLGVQSSTSLSAAWNLVEKIALLHESEDEGRISSGIYSEAAHAQSGLPSWDDSEWAEFRALLGAAWFSRIWVLQEIVLSTLEPLMLHAHRHLYLWGRLEQAAAWLRRKGYLRLRSMPEQLRNVNTIGHLRQATVNWPLGALLSITQIKFRAIDQRDKVYALLGLALECSDAMPDALKPDYTLDVAQLYQKVTYFLLQCSNSARTTLAIRTRTRGTTGSLTRAERQHNLPGMPSWTPDWSDFKVLNNGIRTSLAWVHYMGGVQPPHLGYPKHFSAAGGLTATIYDGQDPGILRLDGILCTRVSEVLRFPHNGSTNQEFGQMLSDNIAHVWGSCTAAQVKSIVDIETWLTRFIRTTTADQHQLTGRSFEQGIRDGMAFLLTILGHVDGQEAQVSFPDHIFHGEGAEEEKKHSLTELLRCMSKGGDAEHYTVLARNYCFNRSFILTGSGSMGLAPSDTQEGDYISVILGGDVPYIIRQSSHNWVFMGEAYVDGLMNGEAVQACRQGTASREVLEMV